MKFFNFLSNQKRVFAKVFVLIFVFSSIFFLSPKKTEAGIPVADWLNTTFHSINTVLGSITAGGTTVNAANSTAFNIKEFIGKPLAVLFARNILRGITAQTVNWINSGFKGNPAYVTNPAQFFQNQADNVAARFFSSALNNLCSPFRAQVRLALVRNYLTENDPTNYSCTLDKMETNFNSFMDDFNNGGWESWFAITQNDQNNPYGSYLEAKNQLSIQIGNRMILKDKELLQGAGFLSYKKCAAWSPKSQAGQISEGGTPVTGSCTTDEESAGLCTQGSDVDTNINSTYQEEEGDEENGQVCIRSETVTPGSVIGSQLNKVVSSPVLQLEMTNDINQIVSALMQQLFTQVVGGIRGLKGTSQPQASANGARSLLEKMADLSPESTAENASVESGINGQIPSNLNSTSPLYTPPTKEEIRKSVEENAAECGERCQDTTTPGATTP